MRSDYARTERLVGSSGSTLLTRTAAVRPLYMAAERREADVGVPTTAAH